LQLIQKLFRAIKPVSLWQVLLFMATLFLCLPILTILSSLFQDYSSTWQHLAQTTLSDYITNSFWLMIGVGIGTLLLGVSSAWVTVMYDFPGRKIFQWALLLPMAMPAYIIAYTYTGFLDFSGPLQTSLREWFGWKYGDYWFPEIRSLGGAIVMLSLVLYPYVYLITRASFLEQSGNLFEASRSLGRSTWQTFYRVALPMARPGIIAGLSLALMETLADFGTVEYFGVQTFTTGIFRTWFGLGELQTATQLASLLLLFVFALILTELWSRKKMRFFSSTRSNRPNQPLNISPLKKSLCIILCSLPLVFGFILPLLQLASWSIGHWQENFNSDFILLIKNTFLLAASAALIAVLVSLFLVYFQRLQPTKLGFFTIRMASMSYALPGLLIAVGLIIPFSWFDNSIDSWLTNQFNISTGLLLSGSLFILISAYVIRFLSVSTQTIESGLTKISPHLDESARSMGHSAFSILKNIHAPLLKKSLLTALLLVFVDVLKELPATLVLRPFNFNTLAVKAYELASDERLADAAMPGIAIVLIGLLPIIILTRQIISKKQ
jgi:iron(III) transport system permease protein